MDSLRSRCPPGTPWRDTEHRTSSPGRASQLSRRGLLAGLGTVAASALAGCSEITSYEFRADAVVLPPPERAELDYGRTAQEPITIDRSQNVGGATVDATIRSHVASYESNWRLEGAPDDETSYPFRIGALSTPEASVLRTSLNPLTEIGLQDVLTHDDATAFFDRVGLAAADDSAWVRGPTPIGDDRTTLLDDTAVIESFGGVIEAGGTYSITFAHLARTTVEETAVITMGVHDREVESPDGPYVGDGGFLSGNGFERAVSAMNESNAEFALVSE